MAERHDAYDWNDARIVAAVARNGSLSAAAADLGINQATASRHLTVIEERAGAPLFERGKRGAAATARGALLADSAGRIAASISEFWRIAEAQNLASRKITVKATEGLNNYLIEPFIANIPFGPMYRARLTMDIPDLGNVRIVETRSSDQEDIGFAWASAGERPDLPANAEARRVATVPMTLAMSKSYAQEIGRVPTSPADLAGLRVVVLASIQRDGPLATTFAPWLAAARNAVAQGAALLESSLADNAIRIAGESGGVLGIACYGALQRPDLIAFDIGLPPMEPDLWIYMTATSAGDAGVRRVHDLLVEGFRRAVLRPCADCVPDGRERPCRRDPRVGAAVAEPTP